MQDAYITVSAAAEKLGMSTSGVYKLIERGKLPAIRRSERGLRVSRLALDAYRRRLRGWVPIPAIRFVSTDVDAVRVEFERETGVTPGEWRRRWEAEEIEDSAENMQLSIRALSLLLREQDEPPHAADQRVKSASRRRSAA